MTRINQSRFGLNRWTQPTAALQRYHWRRMDLRPFAASAGQLHLFSRGHPGVGVAFADRFFASGAMTNAAVLGGWGAMMRQSSLSAWTRPLRREALLDVREARHNALHVAAFSYAAQNRQVLAAHEQVLQVHEATIQQQQTTIQQQSVTINTQDQRLKELEQIERQRRRAQERAENAR